MTGVRCCSHHLTKVLNAEVRRVSLGSNTEEGMDYFQCIVPVWHGWRKRPLNICLAESPLERLVEGKEKWAASLTTPSVFSLKIGVELS
ncbi:hypothetical protein TNCV_3372281 [Trichonephila clavipes]|nr:hypothetical protein TNCV_3372281 [Trichonephila clavipes]